MTETKTTLKDLSVKALEKLNCYKPYLKAFKDQNIVTQYISFGGYYLDEETEPEIVKKMKEIEEQYGGLVYAVINNGNMVSFLWCSKDSENVDDLVSSDDGYNYVYSYVWNRDDDWCSEFGDIVVTEKFGGLIRIG